MMELRRVLDGKCPIVALENEEHTEVMKVRLWRALSAEEVRQRHEEAEKEWRSLADEVSKAEAEGRLPQEVDTQALLAWVQDVRTRSCKSMSSLGSLV